MKSIATSVLLGNLVTAVKINQEFYSGIGDSPSALPEWAYEPFYADTQRFYDIHHLVNQTAYEDDTPEDYYDPTVEAWVAMMQREDLRMGHHHHRRHYHRHPERLISFLGMR